MNLDRLVSMKTSHKAILTTVGLCTVIYLYYAGGVAIQFFAIILFLAVLYVWTGTIESLGDFQLKREKWPLNAGVGVAIGLIMFLIFLGYHRLDLSRITFNPSILVVVIMIAAAEEFFFRGYLQGKLSKDFGIVPKIAIVTALFGLYKFSVFSSLRGFMPLAEIIVISCTGSVILSLEMEKMGSLLAPLISHALWDNLVYSNMETIPSWITATPQWTETLYQYIYKFSGLYCSQWDLSSYFVAGKQFVTCSGCTGIFLGAFFAFFLYDRKLFERLHNLKFKFYVPALLPQILLFFGLNIADWAGVLNAYALSAGQLRIINYSYTFFGLLLGFSGSVLVVNTILMQGGRGSRLLENWLKDYEYLAMPALLLAFLSNPLTNPQMTALIFFSILVVVGIITVTAVVVLLFAQLFIK